MVVFTAFLLVSVACGATGALSVASRNIFDCCAPPRSLRGHEDGVEEPPRHDATVQAESQQPLALSATSSSGAEISISNTNDNSVGGFLVLLQLPHGWQVLRVDSFSSAVPLFNLASIRCPPRQRPILHAAVRRLAVWPAGSNTAAQLPAAATATTTALIPSVMRTIDACTLHLCNVGPGNTDEYLEPLALSNYCSVGKALVRVDPSSCTAKAEAALVSRTSRSALPRRLKIAPWPPTISDGKIARGGGSSFGGAVPTWSCSLSRYSLEGGTSKVGGRCDFISDGSTGGKTSSWSWSTDAFGEEAMPTGVRTTQRQQSVEDELVATMGIMGEEDAVPKQETLSVSTTPPLTPASTTPSPAVATSADSNKKITNSSFFATSCEDDGGSSGTDASPFEEEMKSVQIQQQVIGAAQHDQVFAPPLCTEAELTNPKVDVQAVQGSGAPLKKAKLGLVDIRETPQKAPPAAEERPGGQINAVDQVRTSEVKPEVKAFGDMVIEHKRGQLRRIFINNLRKSGLGGVGDACAEVRMAQVGLGGNGKDAGVLQEGKVLGEGSFGIVKEARNTVLPGNFALKILKEGASWKARYCTIVEMIVLARLAKDPHENLVGAVSIDDRGGATGKKMPILFQQAEVDLATALRYGGLSMPAKLRCLQQLASGLSHMHSLKIVHGDVKPANALMFDDGYGGWVPKLCDFGMARALGEERPEMMGTPAFMPLEVMLGPVATAPSQDVFAMGVMAFLVCVSPDKARANLFSSPHLYTEFEALDVERVADMQTFELNMTKRTLADGSYERLMTPDNLHPDLGSNEVKSMVPLCLLPFMDKEPASRLSMACYEDVMGSLATEVEEATVEQAAGQAGLQGEEPADSDEDYGIGLDLDGNDEDYEDNELF